MAPCAAITSQRALLPKGSTWSLLGGQRSDDLVNNRGNGTHCLNFPGPHGHVELEAAADDGFFLTRRPTEWTASLSAYGLGHAGVAIKRGEEHERAGAPLDFAPHPRVFGMNVGCVRH